VHPAVARRPTQDGRDVFARPGDLGTDGTDRAPAHLGGGHVVQTQQLGEYESVWVPNWSSTSCDLGIFVNQPAEQIATSGDEAGMAMQVVVVTSVVLLGAGRGGGDGG
jgi:hypothetical protein